jgi:flavorubredoxin
LLPDQFKEYYFNALTKFEEYLLSNFKVLNDPISLRLTLAFLATMHGQFDLGQAIENLDEDVLKEFLENF